MSIVLTYFKPFNNNKDNISNSVIKDLSIDNLDIKKYELEVGYNTIESEIDQILKTKPNLLILTGEAGNREYLTIEKVAINLKSSAVEDNLGVKVFNERIDDGLDAYFSNVDILELNKKLNDLGYDAKVSLSAGSFICNLSYFYALKKVNNNNLNTKVLFVHFPRNFTKVSDYQKTIIKIIELLNK